MIDKSSHIYLIKAYFRNELSHEERAAFEQMLKSDEALKTEFDDYQLIHELFVQEDLMQTQELISKIGRHHKFTHRLKISSIAAALVGVGALLFFYNSVKNADQLLPEPDSTTVEFKEEATNSVVTPDIVPTREEVVSDNSSGRELVENHSRDVVFNNAEVMNEPLLSTSEIESTDDQVIEIDITNNTSVQHQEEKRSAELLVKDIEAKSIDCSSEIIKVVDSPSCLGEENGSINVSSLKSPVRWLAVDDTNLQTNEAQLYNMAEGNYSLVARLQNGCLLQKEVSVGSKWCLKDHFEINYTYGQNLKFDVKESGKMTVINKGGDNVFSAEIYENDYFQWDGRGDQNEKLPSGSYVYLIQTEKGTLFKGTISIYE